MMYKIIFLLAIPLASCQYPRQRAPAVSQGPPVAAYEAYDDYPQQRAPPVQSAPSRPSPGNSDILLPATVHYVNIGAELAGDYKFGYDTGKRNDGQSFREETRLPDGSVQGAYGYVDETGAQRIVKYRAGKDGFHILKEGEADGPAPAQHNTAYRPPAAAQSAYRAPPAAAQPAYRAPAAAQPVYRAPAAAQPAYRAPAEAQPTYRAPPAAAQPAFYRAPAAAQPRPEPAYVYGAQPAARPEQPYVQRSQPVRPRYTPPAKEAYDDSQDYDYPSNDIAERRLVPVDTTLFNYNIGTSQGTRS